MPTPEIAHARIKAVCEQAFGLVDTEGGKFVDLQQTKTALMFVFHQLRNELPQPYEYWFELVFRNFDRDRDGLIHFNDFNEIVIQYYDHYQSKQAKLKSRDGVGQPDPLPGEVLKREGGSSSTPPPRPAVTGADHPIYPPPAVPSLVPAAMQHYANSVTKQRPATTLRQPVAAAQAPHKEATDTKQPDTVPPSSPLAQDFPEINGKLAIFDDYEFFDKAGQGSFGKVMVVRHKVTKQVRACKAITLRGGQAQTDLIRNETNLLRLLDHPNILKLFETYYDGANIYMIGELCEGGSLLDRLNFHYPVNIKSGSHRLMSEGLVAMIMQQLLAAVACCHAQHVIHRDIKPDNILFVNRSKESPLKLIDFGLATTLENALKSAKELKIKRKGLLGLFGKAMPTCLPSCVPQYSKRRVMTRAGTIHYFSPEMIRGEYTELTDLFSVGIIMYQLLTGIHPFYTPGMDDETSVRFKISKRDVEFPTSFWSHISTDAKDLTRRLLMRDPAQRISAAGALKHRWFQDPLKPTLHGNNGGMVTQSIFEGLREYNKSTKLKQSLLKLLARELTEIQTQDLRRKFLSLDKAGDGRITRDELLAGMRSIGMSAGEVDALMPPSSDQSISYNQFLAALSERKVKYGKSQLREAFKKLDTSACGLIKIGDLCDIVKANSPGADTNVEQVLREAGLSVSDEGLGFEGFCDVISFGYVTGAYSGASPAQSDTLDE